MCTFTCVIELVEVVAYGRAASEALAAGVTSAKAAGPLVPVTVIVPSNFVGLSARRLLGSGALEHGGKGGVANVSFVTPFRLAEMTAADLLLEQQPITNPVLGAAVRQVLANDPDVYRPVAQHEATEAALAALFAELSNVDEAGLESISEEGSTAALLAVKFYRRIAAQLDGFHTEHDLATAAADRPDLADRLSSFGHLIWYLPAPVTPAIGRFIGEALRAATSSSVIVGVSGAPRADEPTWRACEAALVGRQALSVSVAHGDSIISVTDAAEEVREVCSRVIGLVANGVRLDRIGVFFPAPDPYLRIIEQQFGAAGIPANGPDPRRLADSVAGRTLLGGLALPEQRWRRDRVMSVISGGPLRFDGASVRPGDWDQLSRDAGVVIDHADWRRKIEYDEQRTAERITKLQGGAQSDSVAYQLQRLNDRVVDGKRLMAFVDGLHAMVRAVEAGPIRGRPSAPRPLHCCSRCWVKSANTRRGRITNRSRLPGLRMRWCAWLLLTPLNRRRVTVCSNVPCGPNLTLLEGVMAGSGRGVVFGPIGTAIGHDLDAVFVVGCSEGLLPMPRRDDAILPDAVRTKSLDQLESRAERLHHQHRAFLAVLAAAPAGRRILSFPRGDLRSNRRALPSRWLLDTASALAGRVVHATDFDELELVDTVGSFASGITAAAHAGSLDERDLVAVGNDAAAGAAILDHELAVLIGNGWNMQTARASSDFTEFDGNLSARVGTEVFPLPGIGDRALSPSRLETWASCGFRYFLNYVLEVSDRDDPERTDEISALDRGSAHPLDRSNSSSVKHSEMVHRRPSRHGRPKRAPGYTSLLTTNVWSTNRPGERAVESAGVFAAMTCTICSTHSCSLTTSSAAAIWRRLSMSNSISASGAAMLCPLRCPTVPRSRCAA